MAATRAAKAAPKTDAAAGSAAGDDAAPPEAVADAVEATAEPEVTPRRGGRTYRHRELKLPDGGRLVLRTDGTIARFDEAGARTESWTTDDPDWPGYAIRFGLHPEPSTVAPNSSGVRGTRPPS